MLKIKVLGAGCPKCIKTEEVVKAALKNLGWDANVIKVTDLNEIMDHGVMITPAVIINDELVFSGKIPSVSEVEKYLEKINK
ncbi:MAG TPA: thioredoxin family protein [Firmicutes bacterium]|nr:thioredoxin family protein [Bacillota bacterium]